MNRKLNLGSMTVLKSLSVYMSLEDAVKIYFLIVILDLFECVCVCDRVSMLLCVVIFLFMFLFMFFLDVYIHV